MTITDDLAPALAAWRRGSISTTDWVRAAEVVRKQASDPTAFAAALDQVIEDDTAEHDAARVRAVAAQSQLAAARSSLAGQIDALAQVLAPIADGTAEANRVIFATHDMRTYLPDLDAAIDAAVPILAEAIEHIRPVDRHWVNPLGELQARVHTTAHRDVLNRLGQLTEDVVRFPAVDITSAAAAIRGMVSPLRDVLG